MTKPRPIRRGDPFSVRMMNQVIQESKSHRRGGASGEGVFNDEMGNQTFNQTSQRMRLVVPIEEFAIPANPTDVADVADLVKSAKCLMLRIDAATDYKQETRALPFRVWDPISYINGSESPGPGEAFYAVYDSDCKRWHRISGGGGGDGSKRIWFTIESIDCYEDGTKILEVSVTYYTGGCTEDIPGESSYGVIEIEDVCSTLSFYTAEQLLGATGSATYFYPRGAEYCEPRWLVDSICQTPQCS